MPKSNNGKEGKDKKRKKTKSTGREQEETLDARGGSKNKKMKAVGQAPTFSKGENGKECLSQREEMMLQNWLKSGPHVGEQIPRPVWRGAEGIVNQEGVIIACLPAKERRPELYLWQPSNSTTTTDISNHPQHVQILTRKDVNQANAALNRNNKKKSSTTNKNNNNKVTETPMESYGDRIAIIVQERYAQNHIHYVKTNILPDAVLYALLEQSWSHFLHQHLQNQQNQTNQQLSQRQQPLHQQRPTYYATNNPQQIELIKNNIFVHLIPNETINFAYLSSSTPLSSSTTPSTSLTANAILQKIKAATQLALQSHLPTSIPMQQQQQQQTPTRSSRRVAQSSKEIPSTQHNPKPNPLQKGGKVASFLLEQAQSINEKNTTPKHEAVSTSVASSQESPHVPTGKEPNASNTSDTTDDKDKKPASTKVPPKKESKVGTPESQKQDAQIDTPTGETTTNGQSHCATKSPADNADNTNEINHAKSNGVKQVTDTQQSSEQSDPTNQTANASKQVTPPSSASAESSLKQPADDEQSSVILINAHEEPMESEDDQADLDDDFEVSNAQNDHEDDNNLQDVVKERQALTPDHDEDDDNDDDGAGNQEEDDINGDYTSHNPYLQVTSTSLIEWLGRHGKSLTMEDIQEAIGTCLKMKLALYDLTKMDQRAIGSQGDSFIVHSHEEWKKLQKYDSSTFGRCQFHLKPHISEELERTKREQTDIRLKQEKAFSTWRFKGIHGGYTQWPSWRDASSEWLKNNASVATSSSSSPATGNDDVAVARAMEEEERSSSRRSTRRGASDGGVFYGNQSQMSQKKLMQTVMRLCHQSPGHTICSLYPLVGEDNVSTIHRIRTAAGRLIWKRNQLNRLSVSDLSTDQPVLEQVQREPLVTVVEAAGHDQAANPSPAIARLESYLRSLHQTELHIRRMILNVLSDRPNLITASAADERPGSIESLDSQHFEESSSVDWKDSGHEYIGKQIFRPAVMPAGNNSECRWFEIAEFVSSVEFSPDDELEQLEPSFNEPNRVERRMRFRVKPVTEDGFFDYGEALVLTEAQVAAGLKAAAAQRKLRADVVGHPFGGGIGTRVSIRTDEEETFCIVVGVDTSIIDGNITHKLLLLREAEIETDAFWGNISVDDDGCLVLCALEGDEPTMYKLDQSDYSPDSAAYHACETLLDYMEKMKGSDVFMEPVDPIALDIPTYFSVVKQPMDISTLASNLEKGLYSKIPPNRSIGRSPVARMINGPFKDDALRIYENAILFNAADDVVHQTAVASKKLLLKKIEQMTNDADSTGQTRRKPVSVYVDEDSDVDMYEYESDRDDEEFNSSGRSRRGGARTGKRKRKNASVNARDEFATKAIEGPVKLHLMSNESNGLRGPFGSLPILSDASDFSLYSDEWGCRYHGKSSKIGNGGMTNEEEKELDELLSLHREHEDCEKTGLRRSARAYNREETKSRRRGGGKSTGGKEQRQLGKSQDIKIEYCMKSDLYLPEEINTTVTSRLELEQKLEESHERFYARLYQEHSKQLMGQSESGTFTNGSFPPYLGRVVPADCDYSSVTWEIRSEYVVTAIRWVLRGLIASGHLTALDPMTLDSPLSSGVIITNDIYFIDPTNKTFELLGMKRKKKENGKDEESSEEEFEMSAYEKERADRVARNKERLQKLGLA